MIKYILAIVLLVIVTAFSSLFASADIIKISGHSQNSFVLTINFPEPLPQATDDRPSSRSGTYMYMKGLSVLEEAGFPRVPYLNKMFALPAKRVSYKVLKIDKKTVPLKNYLLNIPNKRKLTEIPADPIKNKNLIEILAHGLFRDIPIFSLTIFPVTINPSANTAEVVKSITLEISASDGGMGTNFISSNFALKDQAVLKKLFINGEFINYKAALPLAKTTGPTWKYQSNRYKILVNQTGLYKITYTDLITAKVPVEQFDTRKLRITNRGKELAIYFKGGEDGSFDPGDYLEFWAEKNEKTFVDKYPDVYHDPFSDINIYWMEISNSSGLRMAEESGALTNTSQFFVPRAFREKLHFEKDNVFERFGDAHTDSVGHTMDHWFFDRGITAVGSRTYESFIPWPYRKLGTRTVFVKAMMRGRSLIGLINNHKVEIWLNDKLAANSGTWHNQDRHLITNEGGTGLSQIDITHGNNQLRVVMDQTGVFDVTLLNWFEISYQRQYRAYENELKFRMQENFPEGYVPQFEIDGFKNPDIDVYKLGVSKIVNGRVNYVTADDEHSSYRISFQDEIFYPDLEYVALTEDKKKKPLDIIADTPWQPGQEGISLFDVTNSADYLIVTHDLFFQNALELKTYRENSGLTVTVVKVEDIYDEFNYGIKSPLAIKDFLIYAFNNWDPGHRLLYVNLLGDTYYDSKSVNNDFVPTFLFDTDYYGAAASDHQYALISGDDTTPDLIIGRWPVSNNAEFEAYFDKLKAYESPSNIGEWRSRGLFISGNDGSTPEIYTGLPAFRAQNQRLIDFKSPDGFFTRKLNTIQDTSIVGGDSNFGSTPTLIDYFDEGLAVINFFGHGGGGIWADIGLFNISDIDLLNNGSRLPFIKSMTCFTNAFESASINGIGEQLIVTPDKGAIGVFGASGVGWLHNDFAVGWTLTENLLDQNMTVGEAILYTKIFYLNNNVYVTEEYDRTIPSYVTLKQSMVNHYNLLGDPYVKITIPPETIKLTVDNTIPVVGDTIVVTVETPFTSGSGRIELTNDKGEPLEESFLVFTNNRAQANFLIPEALENHQAFLKVYGMNTAGDMDGRGAATLAINRALLDSLVMTPKSPTVGEEIYFSAHITSAVVLDRVFIKNLRGPTGTNYTLNFSKTSDSLWTSTSAAGPYLSSDTLFFDVQMDDTSGTTYLSRRKKLIVRDPRPDLSIVPNSFAFAGTEYIELSLTLENNSDSLLSSVDLEFYTDSIAAVPGPFRVDQFNLDPHNKRTPTLPVDQSLLRAGRQFFAVIDASNALEERSESNNVGSVQFPDYLFNVQKNTGTAKDGAINDTITTGSFTRFYLPPQGISASSVLQFTSEENPDLLKTEIQPGLKYVNFSGQSKPMTMRYDFRNPLSEQTIDATMEFLVDTSLYDPAYLIDVSVCRFLPNLNRWLAINSQHKGNKISALVNQPGRYALFHIEDTKSPVIEITVNGRILHDDMLVPQNPSMAFILQDENGVDLMTGFKVYIDNEQVSEEDLNVPDSVQNANAISLTAKPVLSTGRHDLRVEVSDAFGNYTEKTVAFKIADGFEVQVYGNYPNPFEDTTIFSFLVVAGDLLDHFSLKIYTVSGRKIREIKQPQGSDEIWDPGYHEIEWDGRDDDGALVANGVYFALIKADFEGRTFEQTMKVAKLK
jgi:hypothetical protein